MTSLEGSLGTSREPLFILRDLFKDNHIPDDNGKEVDTLNDAGVP